MRDLDRAEAAAAALRAALRAHRAPGWRMGRLGRDETDDAIDLAAFMLLAGGHSVGSTIAAALDLLARQRGSRPGCGSTARWSPASCARRCAWPGRYGA